MASTNPPVQLGPTYGALLLATFLAVALWGMTCMQTLIYFIQYPNDGLIFKSLVVWLWLANTAHDILIVKGVYDSLIIHFCDYAQISTIIPEFLWQSLLTGLVCVTSQTFFTYRIWRFTGNRWIFWAILVPICLFELAGTFAVVALGVIIPLTAEIITPVPLGIYTAVHAVAAVADIAIVAGMIVLLLRSHEHALRGTRSVIQKLLILTVNTGIWTALFAVFTFVSILAFRKTLIYIAVYFCLCPLYCNTVLANLNAREFLKSGMVSESETTENTYHLGPIFIGQRSTVGAQSTDQGPTVHVEAGKSLGIGDDEPALRARGNKVGFGNE